ncbi:retrovirus-related pol polyprotein from transposon TNT 1-94 [Tanacetum coccineum]
MYVASLKRSENYKAQPYVYASPSKHILKEKAEPFPPCTHYGFNDHRPDDCRNYPKYEICRTPRRNNVYVLDISSLTPNGAYFFAKALESVNWLWQKSLSHLNFKNINKLVKQNKVLGLPSLVYSTDKPCSACEKGKHKRASFKTKQNSSISKCLHLLYMDLFRSVSPMSIYHDKYTLVIVNEYLRYTWVHFLKKKSQAPEMIMSFIRMVKNQNDLKVKQIRTDNGTEFRNSELESFCDEKHISQNFSSPYTPEQNGVAKRKNRTLIEATRTMLNGSNRSIIVKRHDKIPYEIFREIIPDIRYYHVFGCPVFIHNNKDHLGKFDANADDGYFLGYSFVSKAFRVFNTRRQQIEETYHVTFDESMEAIRFTNDSIDEIRINDSSRYPLDEFLYEDDLSRQYQSNSNISYYIIPHGRSTDLTNTEGTHEQSLQIEQINSQPTEESSGNNTKTSVPITEHLVPKVIQSQGTNHASTISYLVAWDRWSRYQYMKLVNIIGNPGEGMLLRSMAAKLTVASASECLFADFIFEIEPKKVSEVLKHPGWVDAMQEELNQNKKDEHGIVTKNKARLVAQGYSQEEGIDYDETFLLVASIEAIRIFLAYATYMNFIVFQMDVKSAFLNGKLKEEVYVKQPPGFESSEFPDYVCKLDKVLYGLKQAPRACMIGELTYFLVLQIKQDDKGISICQEHYTRNILKKYEVSDSSSVKTPMVSPNNLGPDLAGKPVNKTLYRGMIGSLITATRLNIQLSTVSCVGYQSSPKESHLITVKRIFRYLKGTPTLGLWYPVRNEKVTILLRSSLVINSKILKGNRLGERLVTKI